MEPQFDIVIPFGPFDTGILEKQIAYTKKNIIGHRNIYIVSHDPSLSIEGCITIDERIFPFTIDTIMRIHGGKYRKNGWYLQQLLKLYAGIVIPGILERYLVIDADTFFLKPTSFLEGDKCLYNYGTEYHAPYFVHMSKLHPMLEKVDRHKSGICHHMMFETKYVKEMMDIVEKAHGGDTFYNVFLKCVTEVADSGASEYEIYFNYMLKFHQDKIIVRPLKWRDMRELA